MSEKSKIIGRLLSEGSITSEEAISLLTTEDNPKPTLAYLENIQNTCNYPYCKGSLNGCTCNFDESTSVGFPIRYTIGMSISDNSTDPRGENED